MGSFDDAVRAMPKKQELCEGTCNHYVAVCGAWFCTYEDMADHNRKCPMNQPYMPDTASKEKA